jgi:hypothetical protein
MALILWAACFLESVNMGPPKESQDGLAARFAKFGVTNSSVRTEIYSPVEPNCTGFLPVSDTHTLYWEESGNPEGQVRLIDV